MSKEYEIVVQYFIHHKSGKYPYKDPISIKGSKKDIDETIEETKSYYERKINKDFSYKIVSNKEIVVEKKTTTKKKKAKKEKKAEPVYDKPVYDKSKDMSAEDAIAYIENNTLEHLLNIEFVSEDENRTTVTGAMTNKKQKEENNEES